MIRFLKDISILLLVIAVIFLIIDYLGPKSNIETISLNRSEPFEAIVLGTSHGFNINFNSSNIDGLRLNRSGSTLYYDYQTFKYGIEHNLIGKGTLVFIVVSYHHFGMDPNRTDQYPDDSFENKYYGMLPASDIWGYSFAKHLSLLLYSFQSTYLQKSDSKVFVNNTFTSAMDAHKFLAQYWESDQNEKWLLDIVCLAQTNFSLPILINMPYTNQYESSFSDEWMETNYYKHIRNIQDSTGVAFIDFRGDTSYTNHQEYFKDSNHFKKEVSEKFTQKLMELLYNMGLVLK